MIDIATVGKEVAAGVNQRQSRQRRRQEGMLLVCLVLLCVLQV